MDVAIIYEDDYCLVVNKPPNVLVHHSHFARNIEEVSLMQWVKANGYPDAAAVHRLDRKTSGLVLIAKSALFVASFQSLFDDASVQKVYWALVRGKVNDVPFEINSPVKNERGNYKDALTQVSVLDYFERPYVIPPYATQRYSLVEFIPKTGRYHQLRIHANKIAHPIINDPKHGDRHHNHFFERELGISELFLHAKKLCFVHPYFKTTVELEVDLPQFWNTFLKQ